MEIYFELDVHELFEAVLYRRELNFARIGVAFAHFARQCSIDRRIRDVSISGFPFRDAYVCHVVIKPCENFHDGRVFFCDSRSNGEFDWSFDFAILGMLPHFDDIHFCFTSHVVSIVLWDLFEEQFGTSVIWDNYFSSWVKLNV